MSGYDLDKFFPLRGTCFHCGRDSRHKVLDKIIERYGFGESVAVLAAEYNVPPQAIELVIAQNMTAPLGQAFSPVAKVAKAA